MSRGISRTTALIVVLLAQATLFGLVGWLSYTNAVDQKLIASADQAAPWLGESPLGLVGGEKASLIPSAPPFAWAAAAELSRSLERVLTEWRSGLLVLAATLAMTTAGLTVLVSRVFRQQAEMRESERRFRSLIEQSIDGIVIHRGGIVLFANDAVARILDLPGGDDLRGQSLFGFFPDDLHAELMKPQTLTGAGRRHLVPLRCTATTAGARHIHVDIVSQEVEWEGEPAVRSTISDVTDQVMLTDWQRRHTAVLAAVNDAHAIYLDAARAEQSFHELIAKILHISTCGLGFIAEDIQDDSGRTDLRILAIADKNRGRQSPHAPIGRDGDGIICSGAEELLGAAILAGEDNDSHPPTGGHSPDTRMPEGRIAVFNAVQIPLRLENEILGRIVLANRPDGFSDALLDDLSPVIHAITRIVADFRLVRLREAAEHASQVKSAFLAHVNHELRTPLSGVIANLELLCDTGLSAEQRELVNASMSAGRGLLSVIGNTLDLSKIEAEKLTLDPQEFDLAMMLESIRSIYLAAAQKKGIALASGIAADIPVRVIADEMRLRQVLSNLLNNALKFTRRGRVCLSVEVERLDDRSAWLNFSVDDTGIGFNPQQAEALFRPFQQADQSISRDFGGTGLGLAIAQQLTELHGGTIACDSRPGEGSSFMVSIPVTVTQWNETPLPRLDDCSVAILSPLGFAEPDLLDRLRDAGALACIAHRAEALREMGPPVNGRKRVLVVDWNCTIDEAKGLLYSMGDRFSRVLAVVSRNDAMQRRRWLHAGDVGQIAAPLSPMKLAGAVGRTAASVSSGTDRAHNEPPLYRFATVQAPAVLVVEDQSMNRKILQRQLERLNVHCDVAENGGQALNLLARKRYNIVIADCAMPVMDGLEMTRRLRSLETDGRPRTAVIALTANAITGAAQDCFAAGMDAYLSKPLNLPELSAILQRWHLGTMPQTPLRQPAPAGGSAAAQDGEEAPIDRQQIAGLLDQDDPALLDQVILDFSRSWQDCLSAMEDGLTRRDAAALAEAAHAAKGTAQYGAAGRLAAASSRLESLARSQDWDGSAALIQYLRIETLRLQAFLRKWGLSEHDERKRA